MGKHGAVLEQSFYKIENGNGERVRDNNLTREQKTEEGHQWAFNTAFDDA